MSELLPCPFCGDDDLTEDSLARIACETCGATAPYGYKVKEAWNTRSTQWNTDGWQPIETAPKDGTYFVGWWYCEHGDIGFETNETHVVWWDERLSKWEYYTGRTLLTAEPTRWLHLPALRLEHPMPLPKPPTP